MAKRPIPRTPLIPTARSLASRSIPAPAVTATQRVVNGDFASATGWTQGTGWVIAAGVATGTSATGQLDNTLSSPVSVGASVTWSITVNTNAAGDAIAVQMVNTGGGLTQTLSGGVIGPGTFGGTVTASANGPFDKMRFQDLDFSGVVVLDNASLLA